MLFEIQFLSRFNGAESYLKIFAILNKKGNGTKPGAFKNSVTDRPQ